jgi:hypothetical protein
MFEDFWKQYPRKTARRVALKSWERLSPTEQGLALKALPKHVEYWRAVGTDLQFIPYPGTWLNQGRYEDELEIPEKVQLRIINGGRTVSIV